MFDSLEDADLDSFAFLSTLQRRLDGTSSVLCLVGRSDPAESGLARFLTDECLSIHLDPLSADDVRELLVAQLGSPPPPLDDEELTHLVAWMTEHTGGNPRLVESYLRSLVRTGVLSRLEQGWSLDRNALEDDELAGNLAERTGDLIRELPEGARGLLELAAVVGLEFDASLLAKLSGHDRDDVPRLVAESVRSGTLNRARSGSTRYRFADVETRQALYAALPEERRRTAHLELANLLDSEDPRDAHATAVAHHLDRAGDAERARTAYVRAACVDRDAGAYQEAGRNYRRAWELHSEKSLGRVPAFAPDWIRTLYANSQFRDAVETVDEILTSVRDASGSDPTVVNLLILKGICATASGARDEGREVLASLLGNGTKIDDAKLEAWALVEYAWLELIDGHRDRAWESATRAREIGLRIGAPYTIGMAELRLGIMSWRESDCESALEWLARAHDHLSEAKADDLLPAVWGNQGLSHWNLLHGRQTIRYTRKAAEGFVRQHRRAEAARTFQNLAYFLIEMGQWREAEEALETAELLNRTVRGPREASYYEYCRARLAFYRGRLGEAEEHVERALELATAVDDPLVEVGHRTLQGLIQLANGNPDEAAATGERCLVASRKIKYQWGVGKSLLLLGDAARANGNRDSARQYLDEGARECVEASQQAPLFKIRIALSEVLAESGATSEARKVVAQCHDMQARSESVLWKGLARLAEGKVHLHCGAPERACQALSGAYDTFAALDADRLRAETLVLLARGRWDMGNQSAGRSAWRQAQSLHAQLGIPLPPSPFEEEDDKTTSALSTVHRVLEAAASVSREITSLQSVDQVLEKILDVAITYLGTERGVIALIDPASGELRVRLARNMDRESIADGLEISRDPFSPAAATKARSSTPVTRWRIPRLSLRESIRQGADTLPHLAADPAARPHPRRALHGSPRADGPVRP